VRGEVIPVVWIVSLSLFVIIFLFTVYESSSSPNCLVADTKLMQEKTSDYKTPSNLVQWITL
jgi:hypothetical protein